MIILNTIIVDDHPIIREGLSQLLEQTNEIKIIAQAQDALEAMDLIKKHNPDFAIVDISLKGMNGLDLIRSIRETNEKIHILVLSMHDEKLYAERSLRAGANGYIMKKEPPEKIIKAIHTINQEGIYLNEEIKKTILVKLVNKFHQGNQTKFDQLTDRELEVFKMIGEGKSTLDIATELNLSPKTIETYKENIKRKFDLRDKNDLLKEAISFIKLTV